MCVACAVYDTVKHSDTYRQLVVTTLLSVYVCVCTCACKFVHKIYSSYMTSIGVR